MVRRNQKDHCFVSFLSGRYMNDLSQILDLLWRKNENRSLWNSLVGVYLI